jgi:hypothetical protein
VPFKRFVSAVIPSAQPRNGLVFAWTIRSGAARTRYRLAWLQVLKNKETARQLTRRLPALQPFLI